MLSTILLGITIS